MRNRIFSLRGAAFAAILSVGGMASANAALIGTYDGNDCAGVFGIPFATCETPVVPGTDLTKPSPIIIKFDFEKDGSFTTEINDFLFDSIDGSEFSFVFDGGGVNSGTGTWTYTPGAGDPAITAYVAKGGPQFNLFSTGGATVNVPYSTPDDRGRPAGLSHLSFYDTDGIPEPGSLALLGLGLMGLGLARRRSRR